MMYLDKEHCLLDIETNGLSREKHHVVCIGVMYLNEKNEVTTRQWSLRTIDEEQNLLIAFINFIENFKAIYTYSGKSFDWPFLLARMAYYHLTPPSHLLLIDMKKVLSHLSPMRTNLEKILGFRRENSSSGKALVKLYETYATSGEAIYHKLILGHNLEELKSLLLFYKLYYMLYHLKSFPLSIEPIQDAENHHLILSFDLPFAFETDFIFQLDSFEIEILKHSPLLRIIVPLYGQTLKQALTPTKDYYYIPSQKQLMHKSLAGFIPNTLKRKATKDECYVSKYDVYFKLYTTFKVATEPWYDEMKQIYFPFSMDDSFKRLITNQLFYYFFQN